MKTIISIRKALHNTTIFILWIVFFFTLMSLGIMLLKPYYLSTSQINKAVMIILIALGFTLFTRIVDNILEKRLLNIQ